MRADVSRGQKRLLDALVVELKVLVDHLHGCQESKSGPLQEVKAGLQTLISVHVYACRFV